MIKLTIDGREIEVEPGTTVIQAAERLGIFIPHYCYHPSLSVAGSCRLCLVEVEGSPKEMIACALPVSNGMVVHTDSARVKRAREIVLEFLLLNHPIDCPVCDKAGECLLQDYSFEYGTGHSRFKEPKRVPPFKDLGPDIKLATTRCIMCTRCVRFMDEIAGDAQLTVVNRGYHNEIDVAADNRLEHTLAGNVVDICPVGALLDKNFIHRTRVWHLENVPSVCGECSAGCNTYFDVYRDEFYRIRPRPNKEVNDCWICDIGRYSYKKYADLDRLSRPRKKEGDGFADISWDGAVEAVSAGFGKFTKTKNAVAALVSPWAMNEDAFAVKQCMQEAANSTAVTGLFSPPAEADRAFGGCFVIKGDKFPNQAGLQFVFGFEEPDYDGESVLSGIESGDVKAAYVVHTDLSSVPARVVAALEKLQFLVVEDVVQSPLADIADIVLPGLLYFEKTGTFVNYQRRIQLLHRAVFPPAGMKNTWDIQRRIASVSGVQFSWTSAGDLFSVMAQVYPKLQGLSHFRLGTAGRPLEKRHEKEAVST